MAEPIWKDYYVTLGTNESYQYKIEIDGNNAFQGVAHKRPGMGHVSIKLNDIVADYLSIGFDGTHFMGGEVTCDVYLRGGLTDQKLASVKFYADWSYERKFEPMQIGLSDPINSRVVQATPIPYSSLNASELEVNGDDKSVMYLHPSVVGRINHYLVDVGALKVVDLREYNLNKGRVYQVVESCAKYALYYLNAYGGIDMLLIEGNHSERDDLTRHSMMMEYDNKEIHNRGKAEYAVEIVKSLTLHTSWLSDDEASRMHHLLNSPQVYLFDIEKKQMIPVLLKNTTTEYQTYKGNGGKLVQYTIDVELANERVRK